MNDEIPRDENGWPEYVIWPCVENILRDPNQYELITQDENTQRTAMGWLLFYFLIEHEYGLPNCKNLVIAVREFRKNASNISQHYCIELWEDSPGTTKQIIVDALCKTYRKLGYTEFHYI